MEKRDSNIHDDWETSISREFSPEPGMDNWGRVRGPGKTQAKKKPAPELAKKHWKQCEQCRAFSASSRALLKTHSNNNHYHSHL